jgi:hypothetical protein
LASDCFQPLSVLAKLFAQTGNMGVHILVTDLSSKPRPGLLFLVEINSLAAAVKAFGKWTGLFPEA